MRESVYSLFDQSGAVITWLTPTIVWINWSGAEQLFSGTMSELAQWRYKYTIENYDKSKTYCITVDGGASVTEWRIQGIVNELDAYPNKLDRRSISTWNIDNEEIAKAVRAYKGKVHEWLIWLFNKSIDYNIIKLQFDDMKIAIEKLNWSKLPDNIKWLSLQDIEVLFAKYDKSSEISQVVSLLNSIKEMTELLGEECTDIKTICGGIDGVSEKLDSLWLQETIENLWEVCERIEQMDDIRERMEDLPGIVDNYRAILDNITWSKSLYDKVVSIRLGVNDILSLIKK